MPGVLTPKVDTWAFAKQSWLTSINPRVLAFDYSISLADGEFSCRDLLQQGDVLVEALHSARSGAPTRPLLGVSHSLGGLVLKQALCIANEQPHHYGSDLSSLAGLVFFGTPHKAPPKADTLASLLTILAGASGSRKRIAIPEDRLATERTMLAQLATRFEGINISAPILTVSETKKTKVSDGLLKSKTLLVLPPPPFHGGELLMLYTAIEQASLRGRGVS